MTASYSSILRVWCSQRRRKTRLSTSVFLICYSICFFIKGYVRENQKKCGSIDFLLSWSKSSPNHVSNTRPPCAAAEARLFLGAQGCACGVRGQSPRPRLQFDLEAQLFLFRVPILVSKLWWWCWAPEDTMSRMLCSCPTVSLRNLENSGFWLRIVPYFFACNGDFVQPYDFSLSLLH